MPWSIRRSAFTAFKSPTDRRLTAAEFGVPGSAAHCFFLAMILLSCFQIENWTREIKPG
jgi:hypothetical protein